MIKEFLLILMPGVLSMLVWRRMHRGVAVCAWDYLEGVAVFDFAVYGINVFLIWARNWETLDLAAFGCSGTFKYTLSTVLFAAALPYLFSKIEGQQAQDEGV